MFPPKSLKILLLARSSLCSTIRRRAHSHQINPAIHLSDQVRDASTRGQPIVALESTIISHGMPYPTNLEVALSLENIVRQGGCTPATMAIINGQVKAGLLPLELELLADPKTSVVKTSTRDLAHAVAGKRHGATTVASSMWIASQIGAKVFVTGGIGGVHRGVSDTMDVSNDLTELSRIKSVAVVCSGVKSILDIPKTLEHLETLGVPVATIKSKQFPAFYTRDSGIPSPLTLENELEAAKLIKANMDLRLPTGLVLAVPIPAEYAPDADHLQRIIDEAVQTAVALGISGRAVTPFILNRVAERSGGLSLKANVALVEQNARVGTRIARHLMELCTPSTYTTSITRPASPPRAASPIMIIGGTALDVTGRIDKASPFSPAMHTSNPGTATYTLGGVARNMAEACARCGSNPVLVSAVGADIFGTYCLDAIKALGMDTSHIIITSERPTAVYNAILDSKGDLLTAVADMRINELLDSFDILKVLADVQPSILAFDGNLAASAMERVLTAFSQYKTSNEKAALCFDPTSNEKGRRLLQAMKAAGHCHIDVLAPNLFELKAMWEEAIRLNLIDSSRTLNSANSLSEADLWGEDVEMLQILQLVEHLVVKNGPRGVRYFRQDGKGHVSSHRFEAQAEHDVVSTTGAGDTMLGVMLHALTVTEMDFCRSIRAGMKAASLSVASKKAVSPRIDRAYIQPFIKQKLETVP
ncbi:pseudouridylate synthase [Synchytrium endobioticum]|uniref:Pseudouridylate synthase n=1 Tax=Synchytrium endobioticum TaxID=286115 RepID=A0A507CLY8_9FUNG|nr:pseudouridylate synthase [Synchytrium endobioticum]TPX39926.1 pseudouridylate synthase [Synchytrium endobioticum]